MKETRCVCDRKHKFKRSLAAKVSIVEFLGPISNDTEIHSYINHQFCSLWKFFSI